MLRKVTLAVSATIALILSAGMLTAQKRQVVLDRVVAVVGGSAVLYSDVVTYANMLVEQRREQGYTSDRDPMNESLELLMRQKLLYSQALIDSIAAPAAVESFVEEHLQGMIDDAGSIAAFEAREHMAVFNYREILRQRITEQEYARAMQQHVTSAVTVTPGEVERFFANLEEDKLPIIPEQYVYAQIVRFPSSQETAKRRTRERLLEMRERIISGKSTMAVLARTYSMDPGTAMRGGELSPGPLSQLTKPYADDSMAVICLWATSCAKRMPTNNNTAITDINRRTADSIDYLTQLGYSKSPSRKSGAIYTYIPSIFSFNHFLKTFSCLS